MSDNTLNKNVYRIRYFITLSFQDSRLSKSKMEQNYNRLNCLGKITW